ncbi:MAG: hypothetical protein HRF47_17550 [Chloroflexota bacterium]|jgi:hypothetical protein
MKKQPVLILLVTLALISTWYVSRTVILPNIDVRIEHIDRIFSNQQTPPYQYRVLKPLLGKLFETTISPFIPGIRGRHVLSYGLLDFMTFLGIFFAFHAYLRRNFSASASMIGVLALQAVIPLSTSGYYMEGDFINLLFFILGLSIIRQEKYGWFPLLMGLGALNREQTVFLLLWYLAHLIEQQTLTLRRLRYAFAGLLLWLAAFTAVRMYFGLKPTPYPFTLHIASNTNVGILFTSILPLWLSNVAGFVVLAALAFRKSDLFHRLAFLSLLIYIAFFFINGNLWELAKFLPAYLILIPMSLQTLTGEPLRNMNAQETTD